MTDYIKRKEAIEGVCKGIECQDCPFARGPLCMLRTYLLHTVPSADVVEVVRCKNCKHYNEYDNGEQIIGEEEVHDGWCMRWSGIENVNRHDYCSYGEREEE